MVTEAPIRVQPSESCVQGSLTESVLMTVQPTIGVISRVNTNT